MFSFLYIMVDTLLNSKLTTLIATGPKPSICHSLKYADSKTPFNVLIVTITSH